MLGRPERFVYTGIDMHEVMNPKFTYDGNYLAYRRHAVGYDWMRNQLPDTAMNKMIYLLDADERSGAYLFGAVYDSIAYLFITNPEAQ